MANDYQMGGYYDSETYDEYQRRMEEEERRRQEALNTPVKETIVTNPDGTQEVTVKGTREALSTANPNTPTIVRPGETAPVAPDYTAERNDAAAVDAQMQAQQAQAQKPSSGINLGSMAQNFLSNNKAAPAAAPAPVVPDQTAAYNARIAQLESGANPNIGYHDRSKGTAFGTYGLTDAAYADARRADPSLPADKTQATPEQQTAAMNGYTGTNARQLQQFGIEPNPANLATAHLLGATGLKRFQETGYLSPQAIAANGGEANLRKIIASRQAGTGGAASGATARPVAIPGEGVAVATGQGVQGTQTMNQPTAPAAQPPAPAPATATPTTFDTRFTEAAKDPRKLLDLRADESLTPEQRTLAGKQAQTLLNQQLGEAKGKEELAGMSENEIARMLKSKSEEGSWAKLLLLGFISPALAGKEANKLGLNDQWEKTTVDGQPVLFKTRDGVPIEGYNGTTGGKLSGKELIAASSQSAAGKITTGAEFFQDKAGNVYQSQRDEKGGTRFVNTQTNKMYSGAEPLQRLRDVAAVDTKRQTTMIQMAKDISTMDYGAKLKAVAEFRQKEINAGRPDLTADEMTTLIGAPPSPQATVGATAKPGAVPAAMPAAPAAPAATAGAPAVPGPAVPGTAPTGQAPIPQTAVPTSGVLPGRESVDAANRRKEEEKDAREVANVGKKEIVKDASQIVGEASKLFDKIDIVDTAIKKTKEKNNMGQIAQGTLPGERQLGQLIGTSDARNTNTILEGVQLITAEGMKVLGANPTDSDRDYLTKNIPNETWSAEATREWLESRRKFLERKYDIAKKQVSSGGTYVPEIPAAPGGPKNEITTSSGNKAKRVN